MLGKRCKENPGGKRSERRWSKTFLTDMIEGLIKMGIRTCSGKAQDR